MITGGHHARGCLSPPSHSLRLKIAKILRELGVLAAAPKAGNFRGSLSVFLIVRTGLGVSLGVHTRTACVGHITGVLQLQGQLPERDRERNVSSYFQEWFR